MRTAPYDIISESYTAASYSGLEISLFPFSICHNHQRKLNVQMFYRN